MSTIKKYFDCWKSFNSEKPNLKENKSSTGLTPVASLTDPVQLRKLWDADTSGGVPSIRKIVKAFCKDKDILAAMDAMDTTSVGAWHHYVKRDPGAYGEYYGMGSLSNDSGKKKIALYWKPLARRAAKIIAPYVKEWSKFVYKAPADSGADSKQLERKAQKAFFEWLQFLVNITVATTVVHELAHAYDPDLLNNWDKEAADAAVAANKGFLYSNALRNDHSGRNEVYATNKTKEFILRLSRSKVFKEFFSRNFGSIGKVDRMRKRLRKKANMLDTSSFSVGAWLGGDSIGPDPKAFIDAIYKHSHDYGKRKSNFICKDVARNKKGETLFKKKHTLEDVVRTKQEIIDEYGVESFNSGDWEPWCWSGKNNPEHVGYGIGGMARGEINLDDRSYAKSREEIEDDLYDEEEREKEKEKEKEKFPVATPNKRFTGPGAKLKESSSLLSIINEEISKTLSDNYFWLDVILSVLGPFKDDYQIETDGYKPEDMLSNASVARIVIKRSYVADPRKNGKKRFAYKAYLVPFKSESPDSPGDCGGWVNDVRYTPYEAIEDALRSCPEYLKKYDPSSGLGRAKLRKKAMQLVGQLKSSAPFWAPKWSKVN